MTEEELAACETIAANALTMGGALTMCPGLVRQLAAEVRRLRDALSGAASALRAGYRRDGANDEDWWFDDSSVCEALDGIDAALAERRARNRRARG